MIDLIEVINHGAKITRVNGFIFIVKTGFPKKIKSKINLKQRNRPLKLI